MSYAAAMSTHPDAATAVGEIVGEVLETLGESPDVSIVFVSDTHFESVALIHTTIRRLVGGSLIGCTSSSIVGGAVEVENSSAISLWSACLDEATPLKLQAEPGQRLRVTPDVLSGTEGREDLALVLLTDPFSFTVDESLDQFAKYFPSLQVIGGMASPTRGPGSTRLFWDDEILDRGAVGLLIGGGHVLPVVSQGCRPVGRPMAVTACEGNVIGELAGKAALLRLQSLFDGLPEDERRPFSEGLQIGRVVDERLAEFDRGDFLIRAVMGADNTSGSIAIGDTVDLGDTVQFQIRDATTAREDLRLALWNAKGAESAVVFTCNGRGQRFFDEPSHDARAIHERLGIDAVAGMFCAGEIGPVGTRSFVHGFTTSIAFFGAR